jgi:hypothetical protein
MSLLKLRGELSDYIAVFDADFIPRATFLPRTMALMALRSCRRRSSSVTQIQFNTHWAEHAGGRMTCGSCSPC